MSLSIDPSTSPVFQATQPSPRSQESSSTRRFSQASAVSTISEAVNESPAPASVEAPSVFEIVCTRISNFITTIGNCIASIGNCIASFFTVTTNTFGEDFDEDAARADYFRALEAFNAFEPEVADVAQENLTTAVEQPRLSEDVQDEVLNAIFRGNLPTENLINAANAMFEHPVEATATDAVAEQIATDAIAQALQD